MLKKPTIWNKDLKLQIKFYLPLAITTYVMVITHSLFNAGMARLPNPEVLIAAFAVAKSLMAIFQSPVMIFRQTITAMLNQRKNLKKMNSFLVIIVVLIVSLIALTAFSSLSRWIFQTVMGLKGETLEQAVMIFKVLVLFPLLIAIRDYFAGFSIIFRTTPLITLASVVRISYVLIFILFIDSIQGIHPAYLTGIMYLGAVVVEAGTMTIGTLLLSKNIPKSLDQLERERSQESLTGKLTYLNILTFFAPLVVTTLIHTFLIPIINSLLARTTTPDLTLSVFSIGWGLGNIFLGPFTIFHQVPLNFIDDSNPKSYRTVKLFALLFASFSSIVLIVLSTTPLGYLVLRHLIGASHTVSLLAVDVVRWMSLMPFVMVIREYFWGILMLRRKTSFIFKGKVINLITLFVVMLLMLWVQPANPAISGAVGMIACNLAECIYLFYYARTTCYRQSTEN